MTDLAEIEAALAAATPGPSTVCGYSVTSKDGYEEPCDRSGTGWRWYQDCDHEDLLDVACPIHENEGGRRMHELLTFSAELVERVKAAEAEVKRLRSEVTRLNHEIDVETKHADLGPDGVCDVCAHLEIEDMAERNMQGMDENARLLAEVERLTHWKSEALPVMEGLQDLGNALGLPLGALITGPAAVEAVAGLHAEVARLTTVNQHLATRLASYRQSVEEHLGGVLQTTRAEAITQFEAKAHRYVLDIWTGDTGRDIARQVADVYEVLAQQETP